MIVSSLFPNKTLSLSLSLSLSLKFVKVRATSHQVSAKDFRTKSFFSFFPYKEFVFERGPNTKRFDGECERERKRERESYLDCTERALLGMGEDTS